jgi:hypothetical protein
MGKLSKSERGQFKVMVGKLLTEALEYNR